MIISMSQNGLRRDSDSFRNMREDVTGLGEFSIELVPVRMVADGTGRAGGPFGSMWESLRSLGHCAKDTAAARSIASVRQSAVGLVHLPRRCKSRGGH
jgi:hypothetical protein